MLNNMKIKRFMGKANIKIINILYYLATIILLISMGVCFFKGKEIINDNALFIVLTFIVWMVLLNIKMYRDNKSRIERRKSFFKTHDNDKIV